MAANPLEGITLERIVTELVEHYGWSALGEQVKIKCFTENPSIPSSLKFLRKTPWARTKVESLYLFMGREKKRAGHLPTGDALAAGSGASSRTRTRR